MSLEPFESVIGPANGLTSFVSMLVRTIGQSRLAKGQKSLRPANPWTLESGELPASLPVP
jgi:hypothetical protein